MSSVFVCVKINTGMIIMARVSKKDRKYNYVLCDLLTDWDLRRNLILMQVLV